MIAEERLKERLADIPTEWLERCLAIMALDPETRGDYAFQPVGMPCGARRPDLGPAVYDLACQVCEATWAGIPGDPCWWCERSAQIQMEHQAELLLASPDVDTDDALYATRMRAWADRMNTGVDAGLITERQADTAFRRTQIRRTA